MFNKLAGILNLGRVSDIGIPARLSGTRLSTCCVCACEIYQYYSGNVSIQLCTMCRHDYVSYTIFRYRL